MIRAPRHHITFGDGEIRKVVYAADAAKLEAVVEAATKYIGADCIAVSADAYSQLQTALAALPKEWDRG